MKIALLEKQVKKSIDSLVVKDEEMQKKLIDMVPKSNSLELLYR